MSMIKYYYVWDIYILTPNVNRYARQSVKFCRVFLYERIKYYEQSNRTNIRSWFKEPVRIRNGLYEIITRL